MPYVPVIAIPLGLICCCCAAGFSWFFGRDVWQQFSKTVFGSNKLLQMMTLDIVSKFTPGEHQQEWDELPPRVSQEEFLKMEADDSVSKELEKACVTAFAKGRIHLVSVHFTTGYGPRKEARAIEEAIMTVKARGLENIEMATFEIGEKKVMKAKNELYLEESQREPAKFMVYYKFGYFTLGGLPGGEGEKFMLDNDGYLQKTDSTYMMLDEDSGVVTAGEAPEILVTKHKDNARLIEEGRKWAITLYSEIAIVEAIDEAEPCLNVDYHHLTRPPVAGTPWASTTVGHAMACDERRKVWEKIEDLRDSVKNAERGGASHGLVEVAQELLAELVARTPELPADRCVLDPEGHGVKLLPKGRQRALWVHTGDSYMYEPDKVKASELNNFDLPPKEELQGTSVDPFRPVCAHYAATGKCKLGKRCPWRHTTPQPGDTVREPIMF
jgi:hypothetical protein